MLEHPYEDGLAAAECRFHLTAECVFNRLGLREVYIDGAATGQTKFSMAKSSDPE